ncbi:Gfo/Idh/MocA family oxidoreductase [bacterium]|nr:Gfo/Idh/MocA family oxidoreductase [bacterium]
MTFKKKIQVAIIGAGGISQVSHIPNLAADPSAKLVAVCDTDAGRAATLADRFDIPSWYDEPERMFRNEDIDCVVIATPTISHLPLCQLALESDVDVMIEKPFARNLAEATKMVGIAERTGKILMVGMNHRFRDDTEHLKNLVDGDELGEIITVRAGWLKRLGVWGRPYWFTDPKLAGGGVLLDLGLQMLDLVFYLLGFPPVVKTVGSISHKVLELEVEDTASAIIQFANEVTFTLNVSWANCDREDIAYMFFSGSQGVASLNPLRLTRRQGNRVVEMTPPGLGDDVELYRRSFRLEVAHFIDCVRERAEPLSSAKEALAVYEVVDQLYQSAGR